MIWARVGHRRKLPDAIAALWCSTALSARLDPEDTCEVLKFPLVYVQRAICARGWDGGANSIEDDRPLRTYLLQQVEVVVIRQHRKARLRGAEA